MASSYRFDGSKLRSLSSVADGSQPVVLAICGSFNPIHRAHLSLFSTAKDHLEASGAWTVLGGFVSLVADAYGKPGLYPAAQRAEIADALLDTHDQLAVDRWECLQTTYTRTYYVLKHLESAVKSWFEEREAAQVEQLQRLRLCLVCGADIYVSFYKPGCWPLQLLRPLLEDFHVTVVAREEESDGISTVDSLQHQLQTSPPVRQIVEGEELSLDISHYASSIHFATFQCADNTSSTSIRHLVHEICQLAEGGQAEEDARQSLREAVGNEAAAALVVHVYGAHRA